MPSKKISDKLIELREDRGLSQAEWARMLGMKDYQIRDMERGKTSPSVEMLQAVIDKFHVDARWLLSGEAGGVAENEAQYTASPGEMSSDELIAELRDRLQQRSSVTVHKPTLVWGDRAKVEMTEDLDNYRTIPLMASAAAAGHGRVVDEEIDSWAVIHSSVVPKNHEVRAVRIEGESMERLLPEGTIVAIDMDRRDPREADGRIVAAQRDGEVVIKWWRVHKDHVVLESENPAWSPIYLDPGEEAEALLGQVVWAWQDLRDIKRTQ